MTDLRKPLGREGELEAALYLMERGYSLRDRNWRSGHLELDLVAEYWGEIVFVEVKTRRDEQFLPAREAVSPRQVQNLHLAARDYLARHGLLAQPYRFDLITVVGAAAPYRIDHYPAAF